MWTTKSAVDAYAFKARVLPMIWTISPLLVLGTLFLVPRLSTTPDTAILGLLCCAILFLLAQLGRDRGKAIELDLFREWGGKPSIAMLRHKDTRIDNYTKRRLRAYLESEIPHLVLATAAEEARCPVWADEGYESATRWLLAHTRDTVQFRLLHAENVSYGFRRNTLGLRQHALGVDVASLVMLVASQWSLNGIGLGSELGMLGIEVWACVVFTLVHCSVFLCVVHPTWVRISAEVYGRQLLACCDELAGERRLS